MSDTETTCPCDEMSANAGRNVYYPVPEDRAAWLRSYDLILVNSSAGKDSQAQLDYTMELTRAAGCADKVQVVHCDLGRVEWKGTRELAERQADHYGVRFHAVSRDRDLIHQILVERKKFPGKSARYCTSDQKTAQVVKLITKLVNELRPSLGGRKVRVLSLLGLRRQESHERAVCTCCKNIETPTKAQAAKLPKGWVPKSECRCCQGSGERQELEFDARNSNSKRHIDEWLPILGWSTEQVWDRIRQSGVEHHRAYDLGMPRLSCCFCVFASKGALMLAAKHNPELAAEYVQVEAQIGHKFNAKFTLAEVVAEAEKTETVTVEDWDA